MRALRLFFAKFFILITDIDVNAVSDAEKKADRNNKINKQII